MAKHWKSWCRLCARENGNDIDVYNKSKNINYIAKAIQSYFSIPILKTDAIPTKICTVCHGFVIELLNFTVRSTRVQELFNELQLNQNFELLDLDELRNKYGITSQLNEMKCLKDIYETEKNIDVIKIDKIPEGSFLDENIDVFFKCEDKNNFCVENESQSGDASKESSDDEKPLLKLKIKNEIFLERQKVKCKRKLNVIPEEMVEVKLTQMKCENHSKNNMEVNSSKDLSNLSKTHIIDIKNEQKIVSKAFCEICQRRFASNTKCNYHMKWKHNIIKKAELLICKTCGKKFKKKFNLEEHENMHLPPEKRKWYECPQCDKKFAVQTSLQLHIKAHERDKTFICEECGKAFGTVSELNSHKVVHSEFTPFQCPKCPKSFKRLPSLKNHIDSHEDTKHICPICGCQLNTKTILRRHMVIHSDEKKYKCNFCQKEFKRTKALKSHLLLHTGLKPYNCPFCDQTFVSGSNCRTHQKNYHPSELAIMEKSGKKEACGNVPRLEDLKKVFLTKPENK